MHAATVDTNTSGSRTIAAETMEGGAARERQSRVVMTVAGHVELTEQSRLDAIAWKFLGSELTGERYANWPIDRHVKRLPHASPAHARRQRWGRLRRVTAPVICAISLTRRQ
jgi:starvation-inducible outer membrane lipoprotein